VGPDALKNAFNCFRGRPQELELPSAPPQPIVYLQERNRPQPALDVNRDGGMTVSVGRLRACPVLDYKFVALGHNTIRGAAGAAILNAELMHREGIL
jgi:aspartate-semialdehyde dehydrogenase